MSVRMRGMDQIEEIKSKLDIVEVISGYVALKPSGRNHKGLCPFHQEKSPSFMVNGELSIYKCFGCGKAGDVFAFIQEVEGMTFPEALEMLADKAGVKLVKREGADRGESEKLLLAHEMTAAYYHFLLTEHPVGEVARKYLESREIGEKLIKTFQIGFAMNEWEGLKSYLVDKKGMDPELLVRGGLLGKGREKYYDRFRGRIIFPLRDHLGRVVGIAGRVIPGMSDDKESPKYINSPETLIYHKSKVLYGLFEAKKDIKDKNRVVLVEGELDMISSFKAGVGETVAIKGTALTADQIKLLGRYTKNLIIALDADTAGDAAAKRGIGLAEEAGMNVKVIRIKEGKDPDDVARKTPRVWIEMVNNAIDIYEFYIESAKEKYKTETVEGKRAFSLEVLPIIGRITNQIVRDHYVKKCAAVLSTSEDSVEREIERLRRGIKLNEVKKDEEIKVKEDRVEKLYRGLLKSLWNEKTDKRQTVAKSFTGFELEGQYGEILAAWLSSKESDAAEFIKKLPDERRILASEIYMQVEESSMLTEELVSELLVQIVKNKISELKEAIKVAENSGQKQDLTELQNQFVQWSRKLS